MQIYKKRAIQEEEGIYNYTIEVAERLILQKQFTNRKFRDIYFNKQRSLYTNIMGSSYVNNSKLKNRLKKGIKPGTLAFRTTRSISRTLESFVR